MFILSVNTNADRVLCTQTEAHISAITFESRQRTITVRLRRLLVLVDFFDSYQII